MAKVPALPSVQNIKDQETRRVLQAIVDGLNIRNGQTRDTGAQFVTRDELNGFAKSDMFIGGGNRNGDSGKYGSEKQTGIAPLRLEAERITREIVDSKLFKALGETILLRNGQTATSLLDDLTARINLVDGAGEGSKTFNLPSDLTGGVLDAIRVIRSGQLAANRDIDGIYESVLDALMKLKKHDDTFRSAGIDVDPATGKVTIFAVDQVRDELASTRNDVSVELDAVNAKLGLKASVSYVDQQITLASIDPSQIAGMDDLYTRLDTAELELDAVQGSVALKATQIVVDGVNDRVTTAEGEIDTLQGQIVLKASTSDLDNLTGRVTGAEQNISAIDGAAITSSARDVRYLLAESDAVGERNLGAMLTAHKQWAGTNAAIASAKDELSGRVSEVAGRLVAEAQSRLQLESTVGANFAYLENNFYTKTSADAALSEATTELASTVDENYAYVLNNYKTESDTESAIAESSNVVSATSLRNLDELAQMQLAERMFTVHELVKRDVTLAYVKEDAYARIEEGISAEAGRREQLTATVNAAVAAIDTEREVRVGEGFALAQSIGALAVVVNDNIAAISLEQSVRAEADLAEAIIRQDLAAGVAENAAAIENEQIARATALGAVASSVTTLSTTVSNNTSSIQTASESIDGIHAQHTIKLDVNGRVSGIGLVSDASVDDGKQGFSQIILRADRFAIGSPAVSAVDGLTTAPDILPFFVDVTHNPPLIGINGQVYIGTLSASELAENAAVPAINYIGEFASAPATAALKQNAVYRNTANGNSYILPSAGGTWSLYLEKGTNGANGANGTRGSMTLYASGASWSDATANSAVTTATGSSTKVIGDTVTISNGSSFAETKYWGGENWLSPGVVIDGNLLVSGTVSASRLSAGSGSTGVTISGDVPATDAAGAAITNGCYIRQNSGSLYGLYVRNIYAANGAAGGAAFVESQGGWTMDVVNYAGYGTDPNGDWRCAIRARTANGGNAWIAPVKKSAGDTLYSFYGNGAVYPFTGGHDALFDKTAIAEVGDIMVDVEVVKRSGISDTITRVERSSCANQKGVIGVMAGRAQLSQTATFTDLDTGLASPDIRDWWDDYDQLGVNAVGEGQMNVCGEGGNLEPGDLIVSSSLPGKGMKQADEIVRGYTVAKCREAVTFSSPTEIKQVACIYLCG